MRPAHPERRATPAAGVDVQATDRVRYRVQSGLHTGKSPEFFTGRLLGELDLEDHTPCGGVPFPVPRADGEGGLGERLAAAGPPDAGGYLAVLNLNGEPAPHAHQRTPTIGGGEVRGVRWDVAAGRSPYEFTVSGSDCTECWKSAELEVTGPV